MQLANLRSVGCRSGFGRNVAGVDLHEETLLGLPITKGRLDRSSGQDVEISAQEAMMLAE